MKNNATYVIAEIGQAHEGSLGLVYSYIDALADTGVDAVKFQMHIAEAESSVHEPFRVQFSKEDATRYDYWQRMSFTFEQWQGIKAHCEAKGMEFLCSPFSNKAVDWLESLGVQRYKIGSGEVLNHLILEKIVQTGKPLIVSSGMSSFDDLEATVRFLKERQAEFSLLQCTTSYPTPPERYGLNVLQELKDRFQVPVGYSDHSASIATCIAAVCMGASIVEFHVVFDRRQFGPDSGSSLTIDETQSLVKAIRQLEIALAHPVDKNDTTPYQELKKMFGKSLAINKNLPSGHLITFEDLEAKKPMGFGINAQDFQKVIGRKLILDKVQWDFLTEEDLQ